MQPAKVKSANNLFPVKSKPFKIRRFNQFWAKIEQVEQGLFRVGYIESGRSARLPAPSPLRTGQATFMASGSSISRRSGKGARHPVSECLGDTHLQGLDRARDLAPVGKLPRVFPGDGRMAKPRHHVGAGQRGFGLCVLSVADSGMIDSFPHRLQMLSPGYTRRKWAAFRPG